MLTSRSKTQTNLNVSPKLEGGKPSGQTHPNAMSGRRSMSSGALANNGMQLQSSPIKPLPDLKPANLLASIVHQTDKSGKQQHILAGGRRAGSRANKVQPRGSFRNMFGNIWSAFGIHEERDQYADNKARTNPSQAKPRPEQAARVIELRQKVLPPLSPDDTNKKCLVLDLDETLVHSSFTPTTNPDYIIPVDIDDTILHVFVCRRPGAEEFLVEMAKHYEIVVYTASLSKYADPLLDKLDPEGVIRYRLYREHCVQYEGNYVKDLSLLNRDISQTIIIDNSPMSYIFHPRNAIGCSSFIDDMKDRELASIGRFLTQFRDAEDVRDHMCTWDANY